MATQEEIINKKAELEVSNMNLDAGKYVVALYGIGGFGALAALPLMTLYHPAANHSGNNGLIFSLGCLAVAALTGYYSFVSIPKTIERNKKNISNLEQELIGSVRKGNLT